MKPLSSIIAFCAVLFAGAIAEAVTPLATWDNDFSTLTKGSWTLDANGNTIADDKASVSVTGAYGILLKSTANVDAHTLIIRCKNLDLAATHNQVLFSSTHSDGTQANKNQVGAYLKAEDAKVYGIWQGGVYGASTSSTIPSTYTTLAYNIRPSAGTYVYALSPSGDTYSSTTVFSHTGLRSSLATYNGINIGGLREAKKDELPPATGLEITAIAVFSGTLSEAEMKNFRFGSEIEAYAGSDVKASELNTAFAGKTDIYIKLDAGATLILDTALSAKALHLASDGTLLIKGTGDDGKTKPEATELAKLDFSFVQGGIRRAWLESTDPLIVGFDFNTTCGRKVAGKTTTKSTEGALKTGTWAFDESSKSDSSTALFSDGLSTLTWQSGNVWSTKSDIADGNFLDGYLDDGDGGSTVIISLNNVPYDRYDLIIYCARDDGAGNTFSAKTVNGVSYTCDTSSSYAMEGTSNWGRSVAAKGTATRGENALIVRDLTGPLTITSVKSGSARGCIAAIQLMPSGLEEKLPMLTIGAEATATWSNAEKWDVDAAPTEGDALISLQGDVTLNLDAAIAMQYVTVTNAHVLTLSKSAEEETTFKGVHVEDGAKLVVTTPDITISNCNAPVYNDYKATALVTRPNGNVYLQGAGSADSLVEIPRNGGSITLAGGKDKVYYLFGDHAYTETSFIFDNTTVDYKWDRVSVGIGSYVLNDANVTATRFILSDGAANRNARFTMNGTSSVVITSSSISDSNGNGIMFGHWDGPSTFTLNDKSTFTAMNTQVLVGKTYNNHTININGGTFTTKGIKLSANATGTNKLNLNGGTLVLGDIGITTYNSSRKMAITVGGNATIKAMAETLPITESMTVAEGVTLFLDKMASVGSAKYTLSGATVSGLGTVNLAEGISLDMTTTRFDTNTLLKISESSNLSIKLAYPGEIITMRCSGLTSDRIKLYDTDGTLIKRPSVRYLENGCVVIYKGSPILTISSETVDFSDAANWSTTDVPLEGEIIVINETGRDATIEVPSYYAYTTVNIVSPNARITFAPTGTDQAARLVATEVIKINPASATLVITAAESPYENAITGAGKVEAIGDVKMMKSSSFMGGITIKSGTLSTAVKDGYGGPTDGNGGAKVTVKDGAAVDLANVANWGYDLVITGQGVATTSVTGETIYSGAVKNTGSDVTTYSKQMTSLTLQGDALVSADYEWGLVGSHYAQVSLKLNGHTLTKKGRGILAFANTLAPDSGEGAGTIVVEEGTLSFEKVGSVFNRVALKMLGTSTLNLDQNLSGLTSLQLSPTAGGITFKKRKNLKASIPITLNAAGFDADDIPAGSTSVVLLKGTDDETGFTNGFATVSLGGRFKDQGETDYAGLEYSAGGSSVSAKVQTPENIYHYDFNKDVTTGAIGAADDSYAAINWGGEKSGSGPFVVRRGRSGQSAHVGIFDGNTLTPWWDSNDKKRTLQDAGAFTVTTVARLLCADREGGKAILWGLGSTSAGARQGLALIAVDKTTVSVVTWKDDVATEVCRATNIPNLTTQFHFFAVVMDGYSTRFYVDSRAPVVGKAFVPAMGQMGQLGSFHGGALGGYTKLWPGDGGYYLDDWAVYDAALSTSEIRRKRLDLCPSPFIVIMR